MSKVPKLEAQRPETPPARATSAANKGPAVVLVIDDDNIARTLIVELLAPRCRVVELSSPIGATRTASAESVEVVVLDVQMPNLRGDMVAKLFRNNPRLRHVGVILVSGCAQEELSSLGAACGADAMLSKDSLRTELLPTVARVCSEARRRAAEGK
jgi:PleD family two-component response regulator